MTCSRECGETFTVENLQTEKISTVNATCTEDGKNEFKATATVKDKSGKEIQTIENTQERTIPALGHAYTSTFTWTEGKDADGNKIYTATADIKCVRDDVEYNDVEAVVVKDENASVAATCEEDGKDVFTATAKVTDENGEEVTTVTDTKEDVIPALGHDYGEPVWDWVDYSSATATFTCSRDAGHEVTRTATITSETKDADCETAGTITYTATVELEGKTYTDIKTVENQALGHEYQAVFTWADATDEDAEVPYTATVKLVCDRCEKEIADVPVTVVLNEEKSAAATCEEDGKNVYTATATHEGKEYTEDKEDVIKASGHKYVDEWDWVENATYDNAEDRYSVMVHLTCEICNTVVNPTPTVAMTSEEATCEEDGKNVYTATATHEGKEYTNTKTDTVKALGHEYGEPTWEWAKDNSTASAKFTCTRDEHVERVDAKVTSETTDPTCEEAGKTVYTATCEFEGKTYTDTQEVEIKALGHEYGEPEWNWTEDYSEATATFTCANGHTTEVTAKVTSESKDADCETAGTVTYTATVEVEGKTYTDVKTVEGQALGHDYKAEFTWTEVKDADVPYTATVILTCRRCEDKVTDIPVTVVLNKEASKAATCEEAGKNVYTATATYEGKDYTEDKTDTIKALGHAYGEPEWGWAEDYSKATATFTCTNDSQHVETVEAVITKKIDREAQKTIYTATATLDGKEYTDVQEVEGISGEDLNPFTDVSEEDYYYDAVLWAYNNDITSGTDETHFAPGESCSRAQVVTFLWRTMGEPEPKTTENPFVDVSEGTYYYKAVLWAVEQGITTGIDDQHFAPGNSVTRSQFVTFLHRNEGEPKPESNENPFVDVSENEYYSDAVIWAYENGITTGTDETHFSPDKTCTRGQVVAFLYRTYGEEK